MMKKALLSLLLAFVCLPTVFAQGTTGFAMKIDSISSCNSYTWPRNNQQYSHDTVVTYTTSDTTFVLYFTKMDSYVDTAQAIQVVGDCSATWNGKVWNEMGTFFDTLTAVSTCDSIVKVEVSLAMIDSVKEVTVCGSYTAPWGLTYTESRVIDTSIVSEDCSYHNVITLTVNPSYNMPVIEVTGGCSYKWGNVTLTDTNILSIGYQTAEGCDSTVRVRVTSFSGQQYDTVKVVACDFYKPTWRDTIFTSDVYENVSTYGTYLTPSGTAPCTHHDALDVTIVQSVSDSTGLTPTPIVAGCSYTWNGHVYTDTNTHYHLYTSVIGGCDSMAGIKISYTNVNRDTTFAQYCGDTYNWKTSCPSIPLPGSANDYKYSRDTTVTVTINDTVSGCTSKYTLVLTFYTKTDTVNQYYCGNSYNYTFKRYNSTTNQWQNTTTTFTAAGLYSVSTEGDSLIAIGSGNCKTYRTLNLNLNIPEQRYRANDIDTAVCEKFRFKADTRYGAWLTLQPKANQTGVVVMDTNIRHEEHHSSNTARCYDSIVHVHLVINRNSYLERTVTSCDSYTWSEFDGMTYTESGTYRDTLPTPTAEGCLQIGRLKLTINKTPEINITGNWMLEPHESTVLRAVVSEDSDPISSYKWYIGSSVKSTTDSLVLEDVTTNTDIRLEAKSTKNCTDTSWITVTANVGIDDVETMQVNIYPNPASRYLNIASEETIVDVTLFNTIGQQVINRHIGNTSAQLDLSALTAGTYTLQINSANGNKTTRKIIVNK